MSILKYFKKRAFSLTLLAISLFSQLNSTESPDSRNTQLINRKAQRLNIKIDEIEKLNPYDLSKLTGLPFNSSHIEHSFLIYDQNVHGEIVGKAYFQNEFSGQKSTVEAAWYWSPSSGFEIIATANQLANNHDAIADFFDPKKVLFQFTNFKINDLGEIAGSFEFQNYMGQSAGKSIIDLRSGWLWWSASKNLQISNLEKCRYLLADLDNHSNVLLNSHDYYYDWKGNPYAIIVNLSNTFERKIIQLPIQKIQEAVEFWINNYFIKENPIYCEYQIGFSRLLTIRADGFSINSSIKGRSLFEYYLYSNRNSLPLLFEVNFAKSDDSENASILSVKEIGSQKKFFP